jgi:hypothetical protein
MTAILVISILMMPVFACRNGEMEKLRSEKDGLEKKVAELNGQVVDLSEKLEALGADRITLGDSCEEVREWADMMVNDLGEGIWYIGEKRFPVFAERFNGGLTEIIAALNKRFRKDNLPEVILIRNDKGTVTVGVSEETRLTGSIGSSGASSYMNAVLFTLSSVKGVTSVRFDFKAGEHASPGTYSRSFQKSQLP